MTLHPGVVAVGRMLAEWTALRREIAALERAEHPNIVDAYGRIWIWRSGDLYRHDWALVSSRDWIASAGLPPETLAENWNYWRLCSTCTAGWSPEALARHAQNAVDIADYQRLGWDAYRASRGLK